MWDVNNVQQDPFLQEQRAPKHGSSSEQMDLVAVWVCRYAADKSGL